MQAKIIRCPACGHSLDVDENTRSIRCPACMNTIIIDQDSPKENENYYTFIDEATGQPVATATIPQGWKKQAEINNARQSLNRPLTVYISADSPNGESRLFANSGEAFRHIKVGMMQRHQEGGFDERTQTPMRKFITPDIYLNQMAASLLSIPNIQPENGFPLNRNNLKDLNRERENYFQQAKQMLQPISGGGAAPVVTDAYVNGLVCAYPFLHNGQAKILLLGAELRALEIKIQTAGSELFSEVGKMFKGQGSPLKDAASGGIKGLFEFSMNGGLLGASRRNQQQQTYQQAKADNSQAGAPIPFGQGSSGLAMADYIDWETNGIYGMIVDAPLTNENHQIFDQFVTSFTINPAIIARSQQLSQQISNQMQAQQQQTFNTWQQNHAAQQAAFDSYNKAWWDRTQSQDASRRAAYQSKMASEDRTRQNFSEAIRGVNTYQRPDGSEVEYSVGADRVFMRNGDPQSMRSAKYGEDVPFGWTELKKK